MKKNGDQMYLKFAVGEKKVRKNIITTGVEKNEHQNLT